MKSATDAGSRWSGFNAGIDAYKELGALMYFGSDETVAGKAVGKRIADVGAKHPLCVIQEQGRSQLEARCAGVWQRHRAPRTCRSTDLTMPSVTSTDRGEVAAGPVHRLHRGAGCSYASAAMQASRRPTVPPRS